MKNFIREIFDYKEGVLIWKVPLSNRKKKGEIAGCLAQNGYRYINIKCKAYIASHVVWFWHNGEWPKDQIDHINGIPDDNRIENLRLASDAQNRQNLKKFKTNTSGYTGVSWDKQHKKWHAKICINYKQKHLGLFDDPEEAHKAYLTAKNKYHEFQPTLRG